VPICVLQVKLPGFFRNLLYTLCMIDHASASVSDYQKAIEFYSKLLAPVGYKMVADMAEYKVAGFADGSGSDYWIGEKSPAGNGHTAFVAKTKEAVEAFYKAGLEAGGKDNGKPGYRKEYGPGYYAAFIHDFDGNNIEAVWQDPNPPQE
jgi:catechol 2,3-dioxygenase-like lactoylglutathione lyase family enzyme